MESMLENIIIGIITGFSNALSCWAIYSFLDKKKMDYYEKKLNKQEKQIKDLESKLKCSTCHGKVQQIINGLGYRFEHLCQSVKDEVYIYLSDPKIEEWEAHRIEKAIREYLPSVSIRFF